MPIKVPALQQYLQDQFGGSFEVLESTVDLSTTAKRVISNNYERMGLTVVNLSANDVFMGLTNTVSTTFGIELIGSGAALLINARDDLALVGHEWYGLTNTSTATLYIQEVVRYLGT